ncbi:ubiquitin-conjugating enzyme E2 N, putative (UBC13) [Plasmodium ovale curtisi]|uniref:Ubiquitin-conjugating enzyme E2 N, putative (UBC13) n=1 Tax=Plasmodium ovale curtisi TaxID=864141 RepID=A0A1A8VUP9_PLAOA|nr:ubiquitin-conjugating enzyme E2 N, putative (UBC13) [Plasmodium ovale curtisi]
MIMSLPRRITKETQNLANEPPPGIVAVPVPENYRHFDILINGPDGTPYEAVSNGASESPLLNENIPPEHSKENKKKNENKQTNKRKRKKKKKKKKRKKKKGKKKKKNQDKLGRICLDILKDKWSPALQIRTVLLSIQALLSSPEPDDPLDAKVAEHFKQDKNDAENVAREWNKMYANNTTL